MLKWINSKKNRKGFTLVELIVVIAILGILAALVVPRFGNTLENQKEKTDLANIRTVQSAYDLYLVDNMGEEPSDINNTTGLEGILVSGDEDKYLDKLPIMQSKALTKTPENDDKGQFTWGTDGNNVTYGGKTYDDLVEIIKDGLDGSLKKPANE